MKNKPICLDITGLIIGYLIIRRVFSGIDRVQLKYMEYYKNNAIATIVIFRKCYFINQKMSKSIFKNFIDFKGKLGWIICCKILIKIILGISFKNIYKEMIIINAGHKLLRKPKEMKCLYLLYDIIPLNFPEFFVKHINYHQKKFNYLLRNSDSIICNSFHTQNQLIEYAHGQDNIKLHNVTVSNLGFISKIVNDKKFPTLPISHIDKPYFVILGTIEPRKNHLLLLNVWRRLSENFLDKKVIPRLIIIGRRGWLFDNVIHLLEDCKGIKEYVFELNNLSDLTVQAYLKDARALLFPSFAEGFGLPLVEALSSGTPTIVSDIPVFRELGSDIPEYIDPIDTISWVNMIMEYANPNSDKRNKQLKRIVDYNPPTWLDHFNIVDAQINKLIKYQ